MLIIMEFFKRRNAYRLLSRFALLCLTEHRFELYLLLLVFLYPHLLIKPDVWTIESWLDYLVAVRKKLVTQLRFLLCLILAAVFLLLLYCHLQWHLNLTELGRLIFFLWRLSLIKLLQVWSAVAWLRGCLVGLGWFGTRRKHHKSWGAKSWHIDVVLLDLLSRLLC